LHEHPRLVVRFGVLLPARRPIYEFADVVVFGGQKGQTKCESDCVDQIRLATSVGSKNGSEVQNWSDEVLAEEGLEVFQLDRNKLAG